MNQTIVVIRIILLAFCALGGFSIWWVYPQSEHPWFSISVALLIGLLLILVDVLLKGFSLRGLTGLTFGLIIGILAAHLISISPLFEGGDPQVIYISRVAVFVAVTYLSTVIALRGKDEFNLVIPYVRFEPERVEAPLVVVDQSSLVDGRVVKLCQTRLMSDVLFVPQFVLDSLTELSASTIEEDRNRGNRGLKTLSELREIEHVEIRFFDSALERDQSPEEKMLFVVTSLKGRLLTASDSLTSRAKQEGVAYIDIASLSNALTFDVTVGATVSVKIVKMGKEDGQGVGYLTDGSMVVVNKAADLIGSSVFAQIDSIIPTSGGRMVFGKLLGENV